MEEWQNRAVTPMQLCLPGTPDDVGPADFTCRDERCHFDELLGATSTLEPSLWAGQEPSCAIRSTLVDASSQIQGRAG